MSDTPDENKPKSADDARDQIIVRHPSGQSEKIAAPDDPDTLIRIGRELDNDVVLTDPRASRYHAEMRRAATGEMEIRDLDSANGVLLGVNRIKANSWEKVAAGQTVQFGETRLLWEKAMGAQSTIAMTPVQKQRIAEKTAVSPTPPPLPQKQEPEKSNLPWLVGAGIVLLLLLLGGIAAFFLFNGEDNPTPQVAATTEEGTVEGNATPSERDTESGLAQQTPGSGPTETPTPSGPQLAIPVVEIVSSEVRPIILGALPSTDSALLLVKLRVQNVGNIPFLLSTDDFSVKSKDGQVFDEAGGTTSPEGLTRLGVVDRFNDLNLNPGSDVAESLIFQLAPETYNLELIFEPPDVDPVVLGLGTFNVGLELSEALGTPIVEEETPVAISNATPTATLEPTPTATRPPEIPAPQVVPRSALVGTIAYPVFNGTDYDIFLGKADGSGTTQFLRDGASQPAFNADGSRIAFHSWRGDSRGLVTMDVSGANGYLIANFIEDQLPTWSADGQDIIFLSRRSEGRQSELYLTNGSTELGDAVVIGEGEYPSMSPNGQLAFKGWGTTAYGLRVGSASLDNLTTVTNGEEDTAPILSPDGSKVAFMSRRADNWDIYVANVDGSELLQLTTDESDDGLPAWAPNGNAIAFVSNRGGTWAIWTVSPLGSGTRQLFSMQGSPDGMVGSDSYASRGWAEERISWTAAELVE